LYNQVHVTSFETKIHYSPQTNGDALTASLTPYIDLAGTLGADGPVPFSGSSTYGKQLQAPRCVHKQINAFTPVKDRTVTLKVDCAEFLGVSPIEYMSDQKYATYSDPDAGLIQNPFGQSRINIQISYLTLDGSVLANVLPYNIECWYEVLFSNYSTKGLDD